MVECDLPKVDVVGSNPIARSAAFSRAFLQELRGSAQAFSGPIATLKRDRRKAAVKVLAIVAWVSLLGSDPLVDPWENTLPSIGEMTITTVYEPSDAQVWSLDDSELLNPFEQK